MEYKVLQPCLIDTLKTMLIVIIESVHQVVKYTSCDGYYVDQSGHATMPKIMRMGGENQSTFLIQKWVRIKYTCFSTCDVMKTIP